MLVVSDTSPLIAFAKIKRLDILEKLFRAVLIPSSVKLEFLENCSESEKTVFDRACELFIETISVSEGIQLTRNLGAGERDALALAVSRNAFIIIDDRKGYNEAQELNLIAVSTRAVLRIAETKGIISSYRKLENDMVKKSYFIPKY